MMTDNEIIKALEICADDEKTCDGCVFHRDNFCGTDLEKAALDLIKRQQATIDELIDRTGKIVEKLEKEIRWMNMLVGDGNMYAVSHREGLKKALEIVTGGGTDDR